MFEERIIPKLKDIFKEAIYDIEYDNYEISFQTWIEIVGGFDEHYEFTLPLAKLKSLCMDYGFIYIISGTGDPDTPNRLKIRLLKR